MVTHRPDTNTSHVRYLPEQWFVDRAQRCRHRGHQIHFQHEAPERDVGVGCRRHEHLDGEHAVGVVVALMIQLEYAVTLGGALQVVVANEAVLLAAVRRGGRRIEQTAVKPGPGGHRSGESQSCALEDGVRVGEELLRRDEAQAAGGGRADPGRPPGIDGEVGGTRGRGEPEAAVDGGLRDGEGRDRDTEGVGGAQLRFEQGPGDTSAAMGGSDRDGADRPRGDLALTGHGEFDRKRADSAHDVVARFSGLDWRGCRARRDDGGGTAISDRQCRLGQ